MTSAHSDSGRIGQSMDDLDGFARSQPQKKKSLFLNVEEQEEHWNKQQMQRLGSPQSQSVYSWVGETDCVPRTWGLKCTRQHEMAPPTGRRHNDARCDAS